jgi:hypothetical protein
MRIRHNHPGERRGRCGSVACGWAEGWLADSSGLILRSPRSGRLEGRSSQRRPPLRRHREGRSDAAIQEPQSALRSPGLLRFARNEDRGGYRSAHLHLCAPRDASSFGARREAQRILQAGCRVRLSARDRRAFSRRCVPNIRSIVRRGSRAECLQATEVRKLRPESRSGPPQRGNRQTGCSSPKRSPLSSRLHCERHVSRRPQAEDSARLRPHASLTKTNLNNYAGTQGVEEGAREPVRLALLGPDGPTGTFSNAAGPLPW